MIDRNNYDCKVQLLSKQHLPQHLASDWKIKSVLAFAVNVLVLQNTNEVDKSTD